MKENKRYLIKCLSIITIILVSLSILTGCGKKNEEDNNSVETPPYLQPGIAYYEGIKNKDIEQLYKAFPDFIKIQEKVSIDNINDLYVQYESIYGSNINVDYSFGDVEPLTQEQLSEIEKEVIEKYAEMQNIDLAEGYKIPVKIIITGDGMKVNESSEGITENAENNENTEVIENNENNNEDQSNQTSDQILNNNIEEDTIYTVKYNGSWYLI